MPDYFQNFLWEFIFFYCGEKNNEDRLRVYPYWHMTYLEVPLRQINPSMLKTLLPRLTFAAILILGIYGCKKDNDPATVPDIDNKVPIAHAGLHHELTLPMGSVNLTGTGTDSDGVVSAYLWSQVSGPMESIIENSGAPITNVKFSKSG